MFHETAQDHLSRIGYALQILKGISHALTSELEQTRLIMCAPLQLNL
jgi:hypothetical protein